VDAALASTNAQQQISPTSASTIISPIENFAASWMASSIHGTTIALAFRADDDDDLNKNATNQSNHTHHLSSLVLVVSRTRSIEQKNVDLADHDDDDAEERTVDIHHEKQQEKITFMGGLRVLEPLYTSNDEFTRKESLSIRCRGSKQNRGPGWWSMLGSTTMCSMTGFVPDVDHLHHYLLQSVEQHRSIYDSTSWDSTRALSILHMVQTLAERLQSATNASGGARPFGVQTLMVGSIRNRLAIFTLDPSGGYRSWIRATAIGHHATLIRKYLQERHVSPENTMRHVNDNDDETKQSAATASAAAATDGKTALERCLRTSVQAMREQDSVSSEASDTYEAVVIASDRKNHPYSLCIGVVDPSQIAEIHERIRKELDNATDETKQ
jgi:20S proteasome alpha/beta subunit